jgi:hypothetical protein
MPQAGGRIHAEPVGQLPPRMGHRGQAMRLSWPGNRSYRVVPVLEVGMAASIVPGSGGDDRILPLTRPPPDPLVCSSKLCRRPVAARPKLLPACPGLSPPEVVYVAACRLTGSLTTSPSCSGATEPYSGLPDGWQMWATTPRLFPAFGLGACLTASAGRWPPRRPGLARG